MWRWDQSRPSGAVGLPGTSLIMRRATRSSKPQGRRSSCLSAATAARGRVSRRLFMQLDNSAGEGFGLGIILESRWRGQFREFHDFCRDGDLPPYQVDILHPQT